MFLKDLVGNFNSRPHGGRLNYSVPHRAGIYFNSRPHGGRLNHADDDALHGIISTHALTEGDARGLFPWLFFVYISTHALTEGDKNGAAHHREKKISTHALTEGDQ